MYKTFLMACLLTLPGCFHFKSVTPDYINSIRAQEIKPSESELNVEEMEAENLRPIKELAVFLVNDEQGDSFSPLPEHQLK